MSALLKGNVALAKVVTLFPRLGERLQRGAGLLSGGEQQMLAMGRALMAAPHMLLLDEPSMGAAWRIASDPQVVAAYLGG